MYSKSFTIALLASLSMAENLTTEEKAEFNGFTALYNKHYSTTEEVNARMEIWKSNKAKIMNMFIIVVNCYAHKCWQGAN